MYSSQELKEVKLKQIRKKKKDAVSAQTRISAKAQKSQKKSNKNTPKHSKDNSNHHSKSSKTQNQDTIRSTYYAAPNQIQTGYQGSEYYLQSKIANGHKKSRRNVLNLKKRSQFEKNLEQSNQFDEYSEGIEKQKQSDVPKCMKSPILKKIKMLSSKGAIDFNGQIVIRSRMNSTNKNSLTHHLSENIGSPSIFEEKYKLTAKEKKSKSKYKQHMDSKSKKKQKNSKAKNIKKNESKLKIQSPKKAFKGQHGKLNFIVAQSYDNPFQAQRINLQQVQKDIEEENENVFQFILSQDLMKERGQCLNMIGKICSSMNLKREAYANTLCYIDSFLDLNTEVKAVKTIAIAALMMALKIQQAEMLGGMGSQFSSLSSMQSMTSTKALSISTETRSLQKKKKKSSQKYSDDYRDYPKFSLNRPKLPNILTTVLSHEEIFSEYDRILCKQEIMDMQMQMMVKLNFKLTLKTYSNWIDVLTSLWDYYISQSYSKLRSKISFKTPETAKNFAYLCQLVQVAYYLPYAYYYSKAILVLSIMYLLVRIKIEYPHQKEEKSYENYRSSLAKSTNIIFVDKTGTNELFGEFLGFLKLDMGDIVNSCQYVSHFLHPKILRIAPFESNRSISFQQYINSYQYNPEIYRFFQLKCGNEFLEL